MVQSQTVRITVQLIWLGSNQARESADQKELGTDNENKDKRRRNNAVVTNEGREKDQGKRQG